MYITKQSEVEDMETKEASKPENMYDQIALEGGRSPNHTDGSTQHEKTKKAAKQYQSCCNVTFLAMVIAMQAFLYWL